MPVSTLLFVIALVVPSRPEPAATILATDVTGRAQIVPDGQGGVLVAWTRDVWLAPPFSEQTQADEIRCQRVLRSGALAWGPSGRLVEPPPLYHWYTLTRMAASPTGAWITFDETWRFNTVGDKSRAAEITTTGSTSVREVCSPCYDPALAVANDAAAYFAWQKYALSFENQPTYLLRRRNFEGDRVSMDSLPRFTHLAIAADGVGGAIVARQGFVQRVDANLVTRWIVPVGTQAATSLVVTPDGPGGMFVAWTNSTLSTNGDISLVRVDSTGNVSPGWSADGQVVLGGMGRQSDPRVVPDGHGGAFVTCSDQSGAIRLAHRDSAGLPAQGWETDGQTISMSGVPERYLAPEVASDGEGGLLAAWTDQRNGADDIFAIHILGDGTPAEGWAPQGNAIATGTGSRGSPAIASDGRRGAWIAWIAYEAKTQLVIRRVPAREVTPSFNSPAGTRDPRLPRPTLQVEVLESQLRVKLGRTSSSPLRLDVIDLMGRVRYSERVERPGREVVLTTGSPLVPGVYWVRIEQEHRIATTKVQILR